MVYLRRTHLHALGLQHQVHQRGVVRIEPEQFLVYVGFYQIAGGYSTRHFGHCGYCHARRGLALF